MTPGTIVSLTYGRARVLGATKIGVRVLYIDGILKGAEGLVCKQRFPR